MSVYFCVPSPTITGWSDWEYSWVLPLLLSGGVDGFREAFCFRITTNRSVRACVASSRDGRSRGEASASSSFNTSKASSTSSGVRLECVLSILARPRGTNQLAPERAVRRTTRGPAVCRVFNTTSANLLQTVFVAPGSGLRGGQRKTKTLAGAAPTPRRPSTYRERAFGCLGFCTLPRRCVYPPYIKTSALSISFLQLGGKRMKHT